MGTDGVRWGAVDGREGHTPRRGAGPEKAGGWERKVVKGGEEQKRLAQTEMETPREEEDVRWWQDAPVLMEWFCPFSTELSLLAEVRLSR